MEEKEVTFNIVTELDNEGQITKVIGISSDVDDCLDYLSVGERVCLASELIGQSIKLIEQETMTDLGVVEFDEDDDEHKGFLNSLDALRNQVIYMIINLVHNFGNIKFLNPPEELEFSLVTYKKDKDFTGNISNEIEFTTHSDDITAIDPLQGAFAFFMDTVNCLLEENVNKQEIKSLVIDSIDAIKKDCIVLIDKFTKEK